SFQPYLAPIGKDRSGTEQAAFAIPSLTDDRVQDNARSLHLLHPSSFLVDNLVNPTKDPVCSAAIWNHFLVESHTSILSVGIACLEYFFMISLPHPLTWLEIKFADWCLLSSQNNPFANGEWRSSAQ